LLNLRVDARESTVWEFGEALRETIRRATGPDFSAIATALLLAAFDTRAHRFAGQVHTTVDVCS